MTEESEEDNKQGKNICLCFRTNSTLLNAFFDSTTDKGHNSNLDSTTDLNTTMSSILYDNIIHPGVKDLKEKLLKKGIK